jgi:hypothetical protein
MENGVKTDIYDNAERHVKCKQSRIFRSRVRRIQKYILKKVKHMYIYDYTYVFLSLPTTTPPPTPKSYNTRLYDFCKYMKTIACLTNHSSRGSK